jgi:tetratricopeptide (TPR) repeat protein
MMFHRFNMLRWSHGILSYVYLLSLVFLAARTLEAQIGNSDTDFLYARKLYDDKLYSLAAKEFSRFIKNFPSDARVPDARFYSGMAYFSAGDFENARHDFQYLAIDYPKDKRAPDAWQKSADCYAALGDYAAAANALTSIYTFYPASSNAIQAVLVASDYYVKAGDLRSAKDKLQKLIADQPDIPEAQTSRLKLAQLLTAEQNLSQAVGEFQTIIEKAKDPDLIARAIYEKAKISERLGRSDEARAAYLKIISRFGKTKMNAYALFETGLILIREKNFAEAKRILDNVAGNAATPKELKNTALMNIGDIYFITSQYKQAGDMYKSIADADSDSVRSAEANFKLGMALEKTNNAGSSTERYLRIINTSADTPTDSTYLMYAYLRLAQNYAGAKNYREAAAYYDRFIKKYPHYENLDRVYFQRGEILLNESKDYPEAIFAFESLIRQYPKTEKADLANFYLAKAYRLNHDIKQATDIHHSFRINFPGSSVLDRMQAEWDYINAYYSNGGNTTTESIIYLLGNLIEDKSKDEIAFSYAKLFFQQLKDYQASAGLFRKVIGVTKNKELAEDALYYTALSYDLLFKKSAELAAYGDSAVETYKKLSNGKYSDGAALYLIESTLSKMANRAERAKKGKEMYGALLERFPTSGLRDRMLLGLGNALWELREVSVPGIDDKAGKKKTDQKAPKQDSLVVKKYVSAMDCFDELIAAYPGSPLAEEAYAKKIDGLAYLKLNEAYYSAINGYIGTFPRGRYVAQIKYMLGKYKEDTGDYNSATAIFSELINQYYYTPYADSAAQGIGDNYLLAQQYEKAIAAYQNVLKLNRNEFSELHIILPQPHNPMDYKIAYSYDKLNNFSRALEYYETYLFPDNTGEYALPALNTLANMYDRKQDYKNAMPFYRALGDRYVKTDLGFKALVRMAEIQFNQENYDSARSAYQKLADLTPDHVQKFIFESRIIVCAYRLGLVNTTTDLEKKFNKNYGEDKKLKTLLQNYNAEFLYELGRYYQYKGKMVNYELAYKTYERLLEEYKGVAIIPEVVYEMGVIRFNQGKSKEGFERFQQIPQKFPDHEILPKVYLRMAYEAFRLEQTQTAIDACKLALQNPNIKLADAKSGTSFLIKVYKAAGFYENALVLIQQYLEKFADDDPANLFSMRIDIGVMHKNLKAYDRAIEYLKDLIKSASGEDEAEIQFNIAETYFAKNNFEQALLEYLRIPYLTLGKKFDWASAAKSQAAECYVKLSKYNEAINLYNEIIKSSGGASEYGLFAKQRIDQIRALMKTN